VVKDSVIIGNMAPNGNCGGINVGRDGIMSNCQVIANVGGSGCGGVQAGARAVVVDCVIARNSAANIGGGIRVSDSTVCVKNCLIYCNTNAGGEGGGVAFFGGGPGDYGLINCTVTSNQVGTSGGGINARGTGNNVINCIVYSNESTGDNYDELCFANGQAANTNFYWNNCIRPTTADMTPAPNQGNITNDPLFAGSSTNNYRLVVSSPCVNTGTNQTWMTNALDLDGQPRIDRFSGRVDMGAYELFPKGSLFRMY